MYWFVWKDLNIFAVVFSPQMNLGLSCIDKGSFQKPKCLQKHEIFGWKQKCYAEKPNEWIGLASHRLQDTSSWYFVYWLKFFACGCLLAIGEIQCFPMIPEFSLLTHMHIHTHANRQIDKEPLYALLVINSLLGWGPLAPLKGAQCLH